MEFLSLSNKGLIHRKYNLKQREEMFVGGIVLLLDEVAGAAVLCKQERGFFHPNQQPT